MTDRWRQTAAGKAALAAGSTWLGVGLLGAIVVHLSLASTLPMDFAASIGVELFDPSDPAELYWWPPFLVLCVALCANLCVATALRVPPRWRNAGAWCSHTGLIVLALGSAWYAGHSVAGDSVSVRTRGGWTPIQHVYRKHSFAVYVTPAGQEAPRQSSLGRLVPRGGPRDLDVPVDGGAEGVEVRATRFYPRAGVVSRWADVSPNRVPAVELRITDGEEAGEIVLSPSLPDCRQYAGRGYAVIYHAGLTPEALAKMIAPGAPDGGPGMPHDIALIVTGSRIDPTLAVIRPDGSRWHGRLEVGKALDVPLAGRTVRVEPVRFLERAARLYDVETDADPAGHDHGHHHDGPVGPVIRLEVRSGGFRRTTHVLFSAYHHLAPSQLIDLPGNQGLWLGFSRLRDALPATLQIERAEFQTYPGSQIPKDYVCQVRVSSGGISRPDTLNLNRPVEVGEFQFSQGSWAEDPHDPVQIFLTAASRPALPVIWAGCILICLGFPVAFYVKPLLLRRRASS